MPCFHIQEKLRWNDMDTSVLPHIVWMYVNCCDELINAVLHKTMIQRNVEVIDNTTNTTSSSCILHKNRMLLTWSISFKCKVFHVCLVYLDKWPFSILNQAYSFSCHILSLMALGMTCPMTVWLYYLARQWKYREPWIGREESWGLWLGIWVLYFDRMLNITYRVLGWTSLWHWGAKIDGHIWPGKFLLAPNGDIEILQICM